MPLMKSPFHRAPIRTGPVASAFGAAALLAAITLPLGACAGARSPEPSPQPAQQRQATTDAEPTPPEEPEPAAAPKSMIDVLNEATSGGATKESAEGSEKKKKEEKKTTIAYPKPPDGKWLTDDQGRKYFVVEIPKIEGQYKRLANGRIRLGHGYLLDLAGETADTFRVKIFKVEPREKEKDQGPSPEELAELEASYRADTPSVQRLEFRAFDDGLPQEGQWRNGFDVADMNGDGHPDIVHGPPRRGFVGRPLIFLGDGAGHWKAWEDATFPKAPYDYGDAEAADFNGDGEMDLALGVHLGGLTVLTGDAHGHFARWDKGLKLVAAGQVAPDLFASRTIGSVDWDGDGRPDLVALSEGPRNPRATEREAVESPGGLAVFRNRGDGSWVAAESLGADVGLYGDAFAVGDFDGDGRPDLASGSSVLGLRKILFLNRPDGPLPVDVEALRIRSFVWGVAAADFDGDGLSDLAVATSGYQADKWWDAVDVLLARKGEDGSLSFERRTLAGGPDAPELRVFALGAGDVDGDGKADLATATADGVVSLYLGDGRGGFAREKQDLTEAAEGCRGYHLQLADLDGDGAAEIIAGFAGEKCPKGGSLRAWKAVRK